MPKNLSKVAKWLLWPLSLLYNLVTSLRNYLYDNGFLPSESSRLVTINVGNLTIGGTGKTPHIAYLIQRLSSTYEIAVLSRGYGRTTKGFKQVGEGNTAEEVGDEPLQIFRQFGGKVPVYVCEKRLEGLQQITAQRPKIQIILLDDAFQHRAVRPYLNLLLTDYGRLFTQDYILPVGLLREARRGAQRAHGVVVTKCPTNLTGIQKHTIAQQIHRYAATDTPIFFSTFSYDTPVSFSAQRQHPPQRFWLLSGIAQPQLFEDAARQFFEVLGHSRFADHHAYCQDELLKILNNAGGAAILTTEKDYVKLKPLADTLGIAHQFYYWPIQVNFWDEAFDNWLKKRVLSHQ